MYICFRRDMGLFSITVTPKISESISIPLIVKITGLNKLVDLWHSTGDTGNLHFGWMITNTVSGNCAKVIA